MKTIVSFLDLTRLDAVKQGRAKGSLLGFEVVKDFLC